MWRWNLVFLVILTFANISITQGQGESLIYGRVMNIETGDAIDFVTISVVENRELGTQTDSKGFYELSVPEKDSITLEFSRLGFKEVKVLITDSKTNRRKRIDVDLAAENTTIEVVIRQSRLNYEGMIREKSERIKYLPSTTGGIEAALPSIALGTYGGTGGELSNQYNVRGGNYDENLVYVNDFMVYRPQLLRQGQQEGLSFANPQLVNTLTFSSGGFEAKYGDRMSSVLDIKYNLPDTLKGSVDMSFLGGGAHLEGSKLLDSESNRRFRYAIGARFKTTKYLLSSLDVMGEYVPQFADVQVNLSYDLSRNWQASALLNHNRAKYSFVPQSRSTAFSGGLTNYSFSAVQTGNEVDHFNTSMAGLKLTFLPDRDKNPYYLKFIASGQGSNEAENFDIISAYRLSELESDLSSDNFGSEVAILGSGIEQHYVRNALNFGIFNLTHEGGMEISDISRRQNGHFLQWGIGSNYEIFYDKLNEWERIDSAGYSLPYSEEFVFIDKVYKSRNEIENLRLTAFFQNEWTHKSGEDEWQLNAGARLNYSNLNNEILVSPRVQAYYRPKSWENATTFKLAAGYYVQPPLYREMRRLDGSLNTELSAQKSFHTLAGMTYDFVLGKRYPKLFRFIVEAYYKDMWDLVSYEIDNVRIRYSGENDMRGYVAGIDFRLNGELVPGAESWINLSFLKAREQLYGVQHLERVLVNGEVVEQEVKDVPRPTDQFMHFSMFLQDYLPNNKNFKVHVQFTFGSGLPYGIAGNNKVVRNSLRFSNYHRADMGFSALLYDRKSTRENLFSFLSFTKSTWVSLEVFNMMDKSNTASVNWVRTILKQQYAIPNRLTGRRLNLRLRMEF